MRESLQHDADGLRRTVRLHVPFAVLAKLSTPWSRDGRLPAPLDFYGWLAAHGHKQTFTEHVRARMPVGDETTALKLAAGVPLLVIPRRCIAEAPVALDETRVAGDAVELGYPLPVTTRRGGGTARRNPARKQAATR